MLERISVVATEPRAIAPERRMTEDPPASTVPPQDAHLGFVAGMFDRFRRPLLEHIVCLLARREDAEDVVQETYLRLAAARNLERSETRARAFMFKVARNLAFDRFRQRKAHALHDEAALLAAPSGEPPLEQVVALEQGLALVKQALLELAPRRRQVFLLRAVENLPYETIAARLGVSKRTVEREMRQALEACQRRLQPEAPR